MIKVETPVVMPQIEALSRLIGERIGLDFPRRKWEMLQRVVNDLAAENSCSDPGQFLRDLLTSPLSESHLHELIVRLTIGETYFLRDKEVFSVLRNHILPDLMVKRASERRLDLWCAASSTGEEPYSIAMLLDEKADQLKDWRINILASDLNPDVLEIARKGVYSNWSLRATSADKKARYFTRIGKNQFSLAPHLRRMVSFSQLNLATKEFVMPGFGGRLADIIFCRNVLIYFSAELKAQVIKRLTSLLQPGGWLFVAPSELGVVDDPDLTPVNFPGVIVHQKKEVSNFAVHRAALTADYGVDAVRKYSDNFRAKNYKFSPAKLSTGGAAAVGRRPKPGLLQKSGEVGGNPGLNNDEAVQAVSENLLRQVKECFADRDYSEIVKLIPDDFAAAGCGEAEFAEIMALKSRALANLGEIEVSLTTIEQVLNVNKLNPVYYYLAATIKRELADYDAALELYRQALFLKNDFILAHFSVATLLKQLNRRGGGRHLRLVNSLLENMDENSELLFGEGLTAGRLLKIVGSLNGEV
jgi:chemotaxis protein methyltransferase CheR